MTFKVGETVTDDQDYYRDDDAIVRSVWSSRKPFAFLWGLRRSGKTSFLKKVIRLTPPEQRTFVFDFYNKPDDLSITLASLLKCHDSALVLVDEVFRCVAINDHHTQEGEARREIFDRIVDAVVAGSGRLRCLIADAPNLKDEMNRRPDLFPFVENSDFHTLFGLDFAEVRNLLRQAKTPPGANSSLSDGDLMEWAGIVSGLAQEVNALGKFLQDNPKARVSELNRGAPSAQSSAATPTWQETWAQAASDSNFVPWATVAEDMPPNLKLVLSICSSEEHDVFVADFTSMGRHSASALQDYGLLDVLNLPGGGKQYSIRSVALRRFLSNNVGGVLRPFGEIPQKELMRVLKVEAVGRLLPAAETSNSWVIHHLSDLHIGRYLGEVPKGSGQGLDYEKSRLNSYLRTLDALHTTQRPHIVVISGDLTSTGSSREFDECENFFTAVKAHDRLQPIRPGTGAEARQIVIVPGNHDQRWAVVEPEQMTRDLFGLFGNTFGNHPNPFRKCPPTTGFAPAECFPEANLLIYTLNTSMAPTSVKVGADVYNAVLKKKEALGLDPNVRFSRPPGADLSSGEELADFVANDVGFIAEKDITSRALNDSIQEACKRAKTLRPGKPAPEPSELLKIAVCHYNPYQLDDDPIVDLLDAVKMRKALVDANFPIILHGHKHKANVVRELNASGTKRSLVTIGAASLGAIALEPSGVGGDWGFNELVIARDVHSDTGNHFQVKLVNWVYDQTQDRFVPKVGSETSFRV